MTPAPRLAFALLAFAATAATTATAAPPAPKPDLAPQTIQPMRVVVVRADLPDCDADCPRWISAEGMITVETPNAFRQVFREIGDANLPILIRSPGGVVTASLEIGRMLRARHAAIAVTGTRFVGCRPGDAACHPTDPAAPYVGMPIATGSVCASACAFLIAGGETRHVSQRGRVGVHRMSVSQTYTVQRYRIDYREENGRRVEAGRALVEERQVMQTRRHLAPTRGIESEVAQYLTEMGVTSLPLTLGNRVPPTQLRWLSQGELVESGLATSTTDGGDLVLPASSRLTPAP